MDYVVDLSFWRSSTVELIFSFTKGLLYVRMHFFVMFQEFPLLFMKKKNCFYASPDNLV